MLDPLDALDLADDKRLMIVADGDGLAAVPAVRDPDGQWRRARAGDGVAEALLNVLAEQSGTATRGGFTIQSWTQRTALGERAIDVDQTNESVIVGDTAVVKWAAHLQEGPHPAPRRIAVLRDAGFDGMPTPWGFGHLAARGRRGDAGGQRRRVSARRGGRLDMGRRGDHRRRE